MWIGQRWLSWLLIIGTIGIAILVFERSPLLAQCLAAWLAAFAATSDSLEDVGSDLSDRVRRTTAWTQLVFSLSYAALLAIAACWETSTPWQRTLGWTLAAAGAFAVGAIAGGCIDELRGSLPRARVRPRRS
jgi:hypothetical protein